MRVGSQGRCLRRPGQQQQHRRRLCRDPRAGAADDDSAHQQQQLRLTADNVPDYVAGSADLSRHFGGRRVVARELLDGVINSVFVVEEAEGGGGAAPLLLKQALPYVRAVGESFPLGRVRETV